MLPVHRKCGVHFDKTRNGYTINQQGTLDRSKLNKIKFLPNFINLEFSTTVPGFVIICICFC